ncbi:MAG: stalk domain-containing protein [Armatimonadota bacterium]|nr:stalk domain-containing protein [Armatimonadota bacterium]
MSNISHKRILHSCAALGAAAVLLLPSGAGAQTTAPIQVVLNGKSLTFAHTPPMQIKGSTLVPMRDIFEALGATVKFDKASQTVYGQKGATAIILPLGALEATVNGQPHTLPQPAQLIRGTTLVPLRFISEALGASVFWTPATSTVTIQTIDPHLSSLPAPPSNGVVTGQVTGIYTNTTPTKITLRVGGKNTVVPLGANTIILRSSSGQPATEVPLSAITPGDQVTIQRGDDGTATIVTATFGEVKGTIVSIGTLASGNAALTLDSGRVVELMPDAPITFGGRKVSLSDIKPYEKVVIRTNPANSLGYGVAVVTAANANPTPPGEAPAPANPLPAGSASVEVTSFTTDATKPLRAGDTLTATLAGTPGGKAVFAIPGVAEDIPMKETSAGVYVGTYTVTKSASAAKAAALGRLTAGGVTSALIQAPGTLTIDSQPPKLTDFGPSRDTTVESQHPLIYAQFTDGDGVGVDPNSIKVSVDGSDVTGNAAVTPSLFTYKPSEALTSGGHTVAVTVADKAGNVTNASWGFKVSTSKIVQSFTTNEPSGKAVGAGATIVLTLNAQPGGKATATVGSLAKSIPLSETSPGVYSGEYTVKAGDSVQNAPVTARFEARDGTAVTTSLASGLTIAAGPPPAPKIVSPTDSNYVDAAQPLTVKGKAAPDSTVRVTVSYISKDLGGFLPVSGQSATKDVVTDKNGDWTAEDLSLKIRSLFGGNRDTVFTITATELDAAGNPASDSAKVTVRPS